MRRSIFGLATILFLFTLALLVFVPSSALSFAPAEPAIPAQTAVLDIPPTQLTPEIEGDCAEYEGVAAERTFNYADGSTGTVYLMHNSGILYVCMEGQQGSFERRFGSVYLDPQGDGATYTFAEKDDYGLYTEIVNQGRNTVMGSGVADGWVDASATFDQFWFGTGADTGAGDAVEWRISTGRFGIGVCDLFGIAVYHHWFAAMGDDYGWPSNQWFDQPRTWQSARMVDARCDDPQAGTIAYVFRGDTASATSFYNLLTGAGYLVDLIPVFDILDPATDFSQYDLIIIADDSGYLSDWGQPALTAQQVDKIVKPQIPILGLGEGGYAFFGRLGLFIGWPNGWHGPQNEVEEAAGAPAG